MDKPPPMPREIHLVLMIIAFAAMLSIGIILVANINGA